MGIKRVCVPWVTTRKPSILHYNLIHAASASSQTILQLSKPLPTYGHTPLKLRPFPLEMLLTTSYTLITVTQSRSTGFLVTKASTATNVPTSSPILAAISLPLPSLTGPSRGPSPEPRRSPLHCGGEHGTHPHTPSTSRPTSPGLLQGVFILSTPLLRSPVPYILILSRSFLATGSTGNTTSTSSHRKTRAANVIQSTFRPSGMSFWTAPYTQWRGCPHLEMWSNLGSTS